MELRPKFENTGRYRELFRVRNSASPQPRGRNTRRNDRISHSASPTSLPSSTNELSIRRCVSLVPLSTSPVSNKYFRPLLPLPPPKKADEPTKPKEERVVRVILTKKRKMKIEEWKYLYPSGREGNLIPGSEPWAQELLEFMRQDDDKVELQYVIKWIKSHQWISVINSDDAQSNAQPNQSVSSGQKKSKPRSSKSGRRARRKAQRRTRHRSKNEYVTVNRAEEPVIMLPRLPIEMVTIHLRGNDTMTLYRAPPSIPNSPDVTKLISSSVEGDYFQPLPSTSKEMDSATKVNPEENFITAEEYNEDSSDSDHSGSMVIDLDAQILSDEDEETADQNTHEDEPEVQTNGSSGPMSVDLNNSWNVEMSVVPDSCQETQEEYPYCPKKRRLNNFLADQNGSRAENETQKSPTATHVPPPSAEELELKRERIRFGLIILSSLNDLCLKYDDIFIGRPFLDGFMEVLLKAKNTNSVRNTCIGYRNYISDAIQNVLSQDLVADRPPQF